MLLLLTLLYAIHCYSNTSSIKHNNELWIARDIKCKCASWTLQASNFPWYLLDGNLSTFIKYLTNILRSFETQPGKSQPHPYPESGYTTFDPTQIPSSYFLSISGVVPRPIALTSTQSLAGIRNVAPFSYFNIIAHDPPTVVIGICRNAGSGTKKDTLINIEETGEFVVNIISDWMVEAANHTCGAFPPEVDEMQLRYGSYLFSFLITSQ